MYLYKSDLIAQLDRFYCFSQLCRFVSLDLGSTNIPQQLKGYYQCMPPALRESLGGIVVNDFRLQAHRIQV
jgi:hypothetical protein